MRKVTAMAAKAPVIAALQDKGDPTLPSLGTTIVVSVMKNSPSARVLALEAARVASDSSQTLNSPAAFEFHRRSGI
jgi:hypothetical protein